MCSKPLPGAPLPQSQFEASQLGCLAVVPGFGCCKSSFMHQTAEEFMSPALSRRTMCVQVCCGKKNQTGHLLVLLGTQNRCQACKTPLQILTPLGQYCQGLGLFVSLWEIPFWIHPNWIHPLTSLPDFAAEQWWHTQNLRPPCQHRVWGEGRVPAGAVLACQSQEGCSELPGA